MTEGVADEPRGTAWSGRSDGPGPEHRRWHDVVHVAGAVRPSEVMDPPGAPSLSAGTATAALIGFASDEGVRRNHGRPGAATGPAALRRALAPLAVHGEFNLHDAGDVTVAGEDLESGQEQLGQRVARLLEDHRLVVVLGGGHEAAYGGYRGLAASSRGVGGGRLGILNLDAHFDLRAADRATSGTPFRQIAEAEAAAGRPFRYAVLGISPPSNTRALFDTADRLGVHHLTDEDCVARPERVASFVDEFLDRSDVVHLSVDLDVLPAAVAPGVSAPAGFGVPLHVIHAVCRQVAGSGKTALLDVVELNPRFDVDGRTARTAARLITTVVHTVAARAAPQRERG
ncbi:MAG: formimidoylglutamase [Micrococcus sp.]|nr:formimidoylglutamase [Micrococcus sp.]